MFDSFMGKPLTFWLELYARTDKNFTDESLLLEVAELRKKISMYESRIKQMATIMEAENGKE